MQFHEDPRVIAWWQARLGGLLRWSTPVRRRAILAAGAIWVCIDNGTDSIELADLRTSTGVMAAGLIVLALLAISWLLYRVAVSFSSLPLLVRKHPQITLHAIFWAFLVVVWTTLPAAGIWRMVLIGVAALFPFMVWRFGYLLMSAQHGRMKGTRFSDHFLTFWPLYGGTPTPYGKGWGYLSRCEAKNEEELARSHLAGLKLLVLAGMWYVCRITMEGVLYGSGNALTRKLGGHTLGIPTVSDLIDKDVANTKLWASWASIYCELIYQVFLRAVRGHVIIAILRLFGFNVFRNTYKPLLSESVVEFWNRYYYYFKEVMANFFFLPTFTQFGSKLRKWPNLRLFVAVMAAAFIGNTYYHLIDLEQFMVQGRVFDGLYALRSRTFYCLLLAIGIYISMRREQSRLGRSPASGTMRRILRIAGVWTFFSLIYIWNIRSEASFTDRVNFFLSLFGIG